MWSMSCGFVSSVSLFAFTLIVFYLLADGDGYQDHLIPVCEDDNCQRSAIYLAKSLSSEVHNAHSDSGLALGFLDWQSIS